MIRFILRLAIAAFIVNATWRVGSAYMTYYRFTDTVTQTAQYSKGKSEEELRQRVLELAAEYDVPLGENAVTVRRKSNHTFVDGSFTKPVDLLPGYRYPWPFRVNIDVFTITPVKLGDLANPQ